MPSLHGDPDADLLPIKGNPPSLLNVPPGCVFHPRCAYAMLNGGPCDIEVPGLLPLTLSDQPGHTVSCHLPERERMRTYEEDIASVGVAL
jgi:peptide/nickel transport system ATP-binding protein